VYKTNSISQFSDTNVIFVYDNNIYEIDSVNHALINLYKEYSPTDLGILIFLKSIVNITITIIVSRVIHKVIKDVSFPVHLYKKYHIITTNNLSKLS